MIRIDFRIAAIVAASISLCAVSMTSWCPRCSGAYLPSVSPLVTAAACGLGVVSVRQGQPVAACGANPAPAALDADVNTYLDFRLPDTYPQPVTMRHLLTHTAGLDERLLGSAASRLRQEQVLTPQQFLTSPASESPSGRCCTAAWAATSTLPLVRTRPAG